MKYTLCADDYAQTIPVTEGILDLLVRGKINATTCMTTSPYWPDAAVALRKVEAQVGLHFNLTHAFPNEEMPTFGMLLAQCFTYTVSRKWVRAQLQRQLDLFEQHYERAPDFIDGHQHIHHLPVIRKILVAVYLERYPDKKPFIRIAANPVSKIWYQPKALVIALTGAYVLQKMLKKQHIPHNTSFSGVYDFSTRIPYAVRFKEFLREIKSGGLIMCHPGFRGELSEDPIAPAREQEYQFFSTWVTS